MKQLFCKSKNTDDFRWWELKLLIGFLSRRLKKGLNPFGLKPLLLNITYIITDCFTVSAPDASLLLLLLPVLH